jgi:hypothetical protein
MMAFPFPPGDVHIGYPQPKVPFTYRMPEAIEVDRGAAQRVIQAMIAAKEFLLSMGRLNEAQAQQSGIDCLKKAAQFL